jgi:hypothetical protein
MNRTDALINRVMVVVVVAVAAVVVVVVVVSFGDSNYYLKVLQILFTLNLSDITANLCTTGMSVFHTQFVSMFLQYFILLIPLVK